MNKGQLIDAVATELNESKAEASRAIDAVIGCIVNGIRHDENVSIVNFGRFTKKQRKGRTSTHPKTGQRLQIEPSKTVGFKASQNLKQIM